MWSSFVEWQQKWLYSVLLKRFLGPYLDPDSLQKFHNSIENVSIQDGVYVLSDLRLNADYLTELLSMQNSNSHNTNSNVKDGLNVAPTNSSTNSSSDSNIKQPAAIGIRSITIHRLELRLSIQESKNEPGEGASTSSIAWRALQLGTSIAKRKTTYSSTNSADTSFSTTIDGGGTSLDVKVYFDGISIELEPMAYRNKGPKCKRSKLKRPATVNRTTQTKASDENDAYNKKIGSHGNLAYNGSSNFEHNINESMEMKKVLKEDNDSDENNKHDVDNGFLSSYLDSILKSLRFSVCVTNLSIRIYSRTKDNKTNTTKKTSFNPLTSKMSEQVVESWVQLNFLSFSYHDLQHQQNRQNQQQLQGVPSDVPVTIEYETILHKAISFHDRITILTGDRVVVQQPVEQQQTAQQRSPLSGQETVEGMNCADSTPITTATTMFSILGWNTQEKESAMKLTSLLLKDSNVSMIALLDTSSGGCGKTNSWRNFTNTYDDTNSHQITLRVVDYSVSGSTFSRNLSDESSTDKATTEATRASRKMMQQDIIISFHQSMNVSVDSQSLQQIQNVVSGFTEVLCSRPSSIDEEDDEYNDLDDINSNDNAVLDDDDNYDDDNHDDDKHDDDKHDDDVRIRRKMDLNEIALGTQSPMNLVPKQISNDWDHVNDFLSRQYQEARKLVEQKQITGGILIPSFGDDDNLLYNPVIGAATPMVTYDAFFDANDGDSASFCRYAAALHETILLVNDLSKTKHTLNDIDNEDDYDWCHTKLQFHIKEGGFKLSFQPGSTCPEEYVLLTFSDFNASSSMSLRSSNHRISISNIDIEDSIVVTHSYQDDGFHDRPFSFRKNNHEGIQKASNLNSTHCRVVDIGCMLRFNDALATSGSMLAMKTCATNTSIAYDSDDDDDNFDEYNDFDDDGILIQSIPCISINIKTQRMTQKQTSHVEPNKTDPLITETILLQWVYDVELDLQPVELTVRYSTITKIVSSINDVIQNKFAYVSSGAKGHEDDEKVSDVVAQPNVVSITGRCDSLAVDFQLSVENDNESSYASRCWEGLYDRCGYNIDPFSNHTSKSGQKLFSIGILFDHIVLEVNDEHEEGLHGVAQRSAKDGRKCTLSSHNVLTYANSPQHNKRFDIFAFCGRAEVDSFVPISIQLWYENKEHKKDSKILDVSPLSDKATHRGSESVPHVLPLSSFKARQEDDDDDNDDHDSSNPVCVVSSKFRRSISIEGKNYCQEEKKTDRSDPQDEMIRNASLCNYFFTVQIPEIIGDLTTSELSIIGEQFKAALNIMTDSETNKSTDDQGTKTFQMKNLTKSSYKGSRIFCSQAEKDKSCTSGGIAITVKCDIISLATHGDIPSSIGSLPGYKNNCTTKVSYCINMDGVNVHLVTLGDGFRHCRFVCNEVNFLEVTNLERPIPSPINPNSVHNRLFYLNERGRCHSGSFTTPLVYRSYLFVPISRTNPSILLDVIKTTPSASTTTLSCNDKTEIHYMNVYLTIYDVTYRLNYDSDWLRRFHAFLPNNAEKESNTLQSLDGSIKSVTRMFVTAADCNIDYCSSQRFKTQSRTIARVGDFRISSNIVLPRTSMQACTVSIGDFSINLCSSRFPYSYENQRLLRSKDFMRPEDVMLHPLGLQPSCEPSSVLHAMNYRTLIVLDSLDAYITVSKTVPKTTLDPYICVNLKIGELGLIACKDSFSKLTATIGEITTELSAITEDSFQALKQQSYDPGITKLLPNKDVDVSDPLKSDNREKDNDYVNNDYPVFCSVNDLHDDGSLSRGTFLLDGYDWTTIETCKKSTFSIPDDEEQVAKWYNGEESQAELYPSTMDDEIGLLSGTGTGTQKLNSTVKRHSGPRLIPHHIPLQPVSDPLADGDMGIMRYAGIGRVPQIKSRLLIHHFTLKLTFFDGYDWPEFVENYTSINPQNDAFVIPDLQAKKLEMDSEHTAVTSQIRRTTNEHLEKKSKLLSDLLSDDSDSQSPFHGIPLAEERCKRMNEQAKLRRLSRNADKFLQFSLSGITLRMDSLEESKDHLLVHCLNGQVNDFFVAESISNKRPVKLVGEWLNESEHPRDSREGVISMKMITWHPSVRVSPDNFVVNDEVEATFKILPLRCMLDQRAISFARALFKQDNDAQPSECQVLPPGLHAVPPPLFRSFRMKSFRVKVNYTPQKIDAQALRDGALVELVNLSPIDAMVLTLQSVEVRNEIGFGAVASIVVRRWVEDICATQLVKFITNFRPFEPLTQVSGAAVDMIVLPWDAFRNGQSIKQALRAGTSSFSKTLVAEAFTVTSRVAQFFAGNLSKVAALGSDNKTIPSRPYVPPKDMLEATPHAVASISQGLHTANYKIIIIPYREYRRSGAKGAVTSILKGIPVAIAAPASGVSEAISFGLLGARNQLLPDIRQDEASTQLSDYRVFHGVLK